MSQRYRNGKPFTPSMGLPAADSAADRSGTIGAASTAQQLMAANSARVGFYIENLSASDPLWINELGTATESQPSLKIPAGSLYETPAGYCPIGAISIIGPTLDQAFTAREW